MRQHAAYRARRQQLVRDAAENPFTEPAVAITPGDYQIGLLLAHQVEELGRGWPSGSPPDLIGDDNPVTDQIRADIGKVVLLRGLRVLLADADQENLLG